ncbi:MAG: hypothetical protein ACK5XX_03690 [Holosporales bacterium]|jgi:hypothetical protein
MKHRTDNSDNDDDFPIGQVTIVPDFLPPPEQFVLKTETERLSVSLRKGNLAKLRKIAALQKVSLGHVIDDAINTYVETSGNTLH